MSGRRAGDSEVDIEGMLAAALVCVRPTSQILLGTTDQPFQWSPSLLPTPDFLCSLAPGQNTRHHSLPPTEGGNRARAAVRMQAC